MTEEEAEALVGLRVYHQATGIPFFDERGQAGRWGRIETVTPHIEEVRNDPGSPNFTFCIAWDIDCVDEPDALFDDFEIGITVVVNPDPEEVAKMDAEWRDQARRDELRMNRR